MEGERIQFHLHSKEEQSALSSDHKCPAWGHLGPWDSRSRVLGFCGPACLPGGQPVPLLSLESCGDGQDGRWVSL